MYLLIVSFYIVCQVIRGQNLNDVRFNETGIQIYAEDGSNMEWFYLRSNRIEYPEATVLCNNLTGNSFVSYFQNNQNSMTMARLDCDVGDVGVSQCNIAIQNNRVDRVNVTCLSRDGWSEGDIRQLPDGRLLYLARPTGSQLLVWAHFCFRDNSWDENVANLLCRGLGYEGVKMGSEQLQFPDDVEVFGLDDFECESQVLSYKNCTFTEGSGNGRCSGNEVIQIECENLTTTPLPNTTTNINSTDISPTNINSTAILPPNQINSNNDAVIAGVVVSLVILLASLVIITGVLIVTGLIIKRKRSKLRSSPLNSPRNLGLSYTNNAESELDNSLYTKIDHTDFPNRGPSEYLRPLKNSEIVANLTLRNNNNMIQDTGIYEGVMSSHNKFVQSVEEREYYMSMSSDITTATYLPEQNESCYTTLLLRENEYWEPGTTIDSIYAQMSQHRYKEIERKELKEEEKLGEGNFGLVMSGHWNTNGESIPVAIKTLKIEEGTSDIEFLQEATILGQFHHINVLKLLGVVTLSKPLLIVTEQMKTGLKDFLKTIKQNGNLNFDLFGTLFLRLTNDIANGMQHLASKKFIHRDLAARNILLSHSLTCKISDFGLARHAIENDEYYTSSGGKIPLKWTAPEAIFYNKYSEKSDVWSFGVTIHEVWTVGALPWSGVKPDDVSLDYRDIS